MKSFIFFAALSVGCALQASAQQPAITYISNSATYLPPGLPDSALAQGSIVEIFGTNIGPTTAAAAQSFPLLQSLSGTSVTFTVNGTSTQALMLFTLASQIAAVLPSSTPVGTGTVTVTYNSQTSNTLPISVVASNFGMYTLGQNGTGPAVITTPSYKVVTLTSPAKPGDTLVLWGTGLGPYSGNEAEPPSETGLNVNASVYVGDQSATIRYEGRSSSPGLDQINFVVPAGLSGCYVPVAVVVNGIVSNFGSVSVSADGSTCSDPAGLPSTAINEIETNNSLKVGFIELQKIQFSATVPILGALNVKQDYGAAYFYDFNDQALLASRGLSSISSFNSCTVLVCSNSDTCIPDNSALNVPQISAGSQITITGPQGTAVLPLAANRVGEFHGPLGSSTVVGSGNDFLQPGSYTASNGSGGSVVGGFTADLTIGSPLTWTNQSTVSALNAIDRTQNLTINFSGGTSSDYVAILGSSTSTTGSQDATVTFVCTAPASAGTFTIPSFVLSALPPSGNISLNVDGVQVSGPGGFLLVGNYPLSNTFTAPGLDLGFFAETVVSGINIPFQ
ncbi:MAG TPA: hypothetical protein VME17_10320 [Bryobacteraceae bacterium]|nr:hypothetical protein [Bryobacteraceae bacterium]